MTDGTFVDALVLHTTSPSTLRIGERDRVLLPNGWKDGTPAFPAPTTIQLHTLTGLRDYLNANVDELDAKIMLHVVDPTTVKLLDSLEDEEKDYRRNVWACANAEATKFPFGQFMNAENFMIGLQSQFLGTPDRDLLVSLMASIRESDVRETVDDSVAQEVKTQRGVALSDRTKVKSPVVLKPWRTFREVDQPSSVFVVRLRSGDDKPTAALFEADGALWKLDAINNIAEWLRKECPKVAVVA